MLAECLYRAGADDTEIEELCAKARETTAAEDLINFVWLDMVGGLLHARRGEYEQAESSAHVERWRWPKQTTSTSHGRAPVRISPRSWPCPGGR